MKKLVLSILTFTALTFGANAQWAQIGADIDGEAAADMSGSAISLSNDGSIMAVGAKENDGGGAQSGHVRIYQNVSGAWSQIGADINGEAIADYSAFSPNSISLSGDGSIVAIGAPGNDGPGGVGNYGHVRVYQNISGTWTQVGADIDGEASADGSGIAVSLSDDGSIVAIGSKENDGGPLNGGHVRVYQNVSGTWTQVGADINGEAAGDYSGGAVSLSSNGSIVAIGAAGNDGPGGAGNYGHVRVYQNVSGTWTKIGADIDGETASNESGSAVSLSDDGATVAIAARNNSGSFTNAGHVRVYKNISGTWTQVGADIDGEAAGDYSGYSLSMNGDGSIVAIGAAGNDGPGGGGANHGHVRVYENVSGTWTQVDGDIDGEAVGDGSGFSVSLDNSGTTVAVGSINNDGNGTDAGHVRVYSNGAAPCNITIPDANFKAYLVGNTAINTNGNGEIECSEATAFSGTINCASLSVADLTGVEAFTSLNWLFCNNNSLTSIDVSTIPTLTQLNCAGNAITTLDVSNNPALILIHCYTNSLTSLNVANGNNTNSTNANFYVTGNPNLTCITVDDVAYSTTNWTNIDPGVSFSANCNACYVNIPDANFKAYLLGNTLINTNGNAEIECAEATAFTGTINCSNSSISDLTGIEAFTSLQNLDFQTNNVTTVDLSANVALQTLICYSNSLTSLDLSNNSALEYLNSHTNALTSLNMANGNNTNVSYFLATVNPSLTCISVDDVAYSTTNWSGIDAGVGFSINCNGCFVNIPDANFKTYLLGNTLINTNGNTEIECAEATAFTGTINCSGLSISDLTGIEAFTSLPYLHCVSNSLTTLDLSSNTSLINLSCNSNLLTSLNVSQNSVLTNLTCENNSLTTLDLSNNPLLTGLRCMNNSLTSLNIANGNNTNVILFNAYTNPNLTCITVDDASYSTSNWTNIDGQTSFSINCNGCFVNIPDANFKTNLLANTAINTNGNTEIECTEATAFTGTISCANLNITDLTGIEAFTGLTQLFCGGNSLTSLDLTQNTALIDLYCQINSITSLDLTQNTALTILGCHFNNLTSLDLSLNTALTEVECRENSITSLDLSLNTALTILYCQDNSLTSLNVANGNNTNFTKLKTINNPNLTCIQVDDVAYSTTNWVGSSYAYTGMPFSINCGTVNINELNNTTMSITPNPATNVLNINTTDAIEQVSIYNVNGSLIASVKENTTTININDLAKGMYILVVKTNNGVSHDRFIKK